MRRLVTLTVSLLAAGSLTACSNSDEEVPWQDGWQANVNLRYRMATDEDFDWIAGEPITAQPELELPGETTTPTVTEEDVIQEMCERFVGEHRSGAVNEYLGEALSVAAPQPSEVVIEALARVHSRVDDSGLPLLYTMDPYDGLDRNAEYDRILAERQELFDQYLAEEPAEAQSAVADWESVHNPIASAIYSEEGVRRAQEVFVEECGIDVPDGYVFPTAAELNIATALPDVE
jgi:hypothetical protein